MIRPMLKFLPYSQLLTGILLAIGSFLILSFQATVGFARSIPPLTGPVVDEINLLDTEEQNKLSKILQHLHQSSGPQIQLLIIDSLEGESIEEFSIRVADQWKLGTEKEDNGVLFIVAFKDRKMRIEVGQGLEGELPDIVAGRILQGVAPFFKEGRFKEGIYFALQSMAQKLGHELQDLPRSRPPSSQDRQRSSPFSLLILLFIFLFLFLTSRRRFLPYSHWGGGRSWGGSGHSWGGRGGGGSWGSGGGGFSGGGASGDW